VVMCFRMMNHVVTELRMSELKITKLYVNYDWLSKLEYGEL